MSLGRLWLGTSETLLLISAQEKATCVWSGSCSLSLQPVPHKHVHVLLVILQVILQGGTCSM